MSQARPQSRTILRTSEKPLEWTPEEATPRTRSPSAMSSLWKESAALRRAHAKAGEIVVFLRVHARHFGRLAADQRGARLAAAFGDARDHARGRFRIELSAGEIVEKEERLGALDHDIVHAHRHKIDADRVVTARFDGDFQLGADAVIGRDEHGIGKARRLQIEEGAKSAERRARAGPRRGFGEGLYFLHKRLARVDVDASRHIRAVRI